ncbi:MAG: hypothetical protein ACM3XS_08345 [Bacteroidota bacterium]
MIWPTILTCILAAGGGAASFWLVMTLRVPARVLLPLGPLVMLLLPPDIAAALLVGAWTAVAFFARGREGLIVPNESLGWRQVARDALGVTVALLAGLLYLYRQRAHEMPGLILAAGLLFAVVLVLCYIHAVAWDVPRQLRVGHGYAVGLLSFIPWAFVLASLGWPLLVLGFLTFLLLPPFFLATIDLNVNLPEPRGRRGMTMRLPRR